jgi:hypothetical protein
MPERGRKISKEMSKPSVSAAQEKRRRSRKGKRPAGLGIETVEEQKAGMVEGSSSLRGPVFGEPSFLQSTYGKAGNFELVVPLASGGLGYYWRNNDDERLSWEGPVQFGLDAGRFSGVSLIQGDFGDAGNLELVAIDLGGYRLMHFWRDSGENPTWNGPKLISEKASVPLFSGSPALIWSNLGCRGNFDMVVPRAAGGFSYHWRDNDDPALSWCGPANFATQAGIFDAVTMIQSNFGEPGNLELVARSGDRLVFFWGEPGEEVKWHGPEVIAAGIAGAPSMIQSTFGHKGNFELVVPLASGGLAYYQRDNDNAHLNWRGPFMFAMNMGMVEGVSLIQSNFGNPGHLELVAQVDGHLAFFWRDSGPDLRWNGPQYLTQ